MAAVGRRVWESSFADRAWPDRLPGEYDHGGLQY